jgi:hypothetical protein
MIPHKPKEKPTSTLKTGLKRKLKTLAKQLSLTRDNKHEY